MKNKRLKFVYAILNLAAETLLFFTLNHEKAPLSVGLFAAFAASGGEIITLSIALVTASLRYGNVFMTINSAVCVTVAVIAACFYKKRGQKPGVETVPILFASQVVYIAFFAEEILYKLVYTAIITLFYFISSVAVSTAFNKKFNARPTVYEIFCIGVTYAVCGLGIIDFFGINALKSVAVFALLFAVRLYKSPSALVVACFVALPFSVYTGDGGYVALFAAEFFAAYVFSAQAGLFSALAACAVEAVFAFLFGFFADYGYVDALFTVIPALTVAAIPQKTFVKIAKNGYLGGENVSRKTISRFLGRLSEKMYDLSEAFTEIEASLNVLSEKSEKRKAAVKKINKTACSNACDKCQSRRFCNLVGSEKSEALIELAIAKGRLTIVDLPKDFLDACANPNPLIFEINRLIDGFSAEIDRLSRTEEINAILALCSHGVEKRLSEIGYGLTRSEKYDDKLERSLTRFLKERGIPTYGVIAASEGEFFVNAVVRETLSDKKFCDAVAEHTAFSVQASRSEVIGGGLKFIEIKKSPRFYATFGVRSITKDGSTSSGDVHSLLKLDDDGLLVALSDGMGSGDGALSTSTATVGLIEGLLKAGIKTETVLPLVNKIISVSTEDNFAAVDIGIINLADGSCDFIKVGAPYGFILSPEGIRFIEGSSLPIGIIDELRPTTASTGLTGGDVVVMLSDGVTDAFGSSTDFIEYLKTAPTLNPQTLADEVVKEALARTRGVAEDDMTCLCVRMTEVA